jgi:hypothetical protein
MKIIQKTFDKARLAGDRQLQAIYLDVMEQLNVEYYDHPTNLVHFDASTEELTEIAYYQELGVWLAGK